MDLYEPAAQVSHPAPAVLYLHGGVWLAGGRAPDNYFQQLQTALNARGFAVASIDYRLGSLYAFPAQIEDPECAVRFLRAHATRYGIDPLRIGAWGASSGGTSADLLAMTGTPDSWSVGQDQDQSSRVQAVVDVSGPTDFLRMGSAYSGIAGLVGNALVRESLFRNADARSTASPVMYVGLDDPPFLIVHGTNDFVVPPAQAQELAERLQSAGVPVQLIMVEGASHVGVDPALDKLIPAGVDFLSSTLAPVGEPPNPTH